MAIYGFGSDWITHLRHIGRLQTSPRQFAPGPMGHRSLALDCGYRWVEEKECLYNKV